MLTAHRAHIRTGAGVRASKGLKATRIQMGGTAQWPGLQHACATQGIEGLAEGGQQLSGKEGLVDWAWQLLAGPAACILHDTLKPSAMGLGLSPAAASAAFLGLLLAGGLILWLITKAIRCVPMRLGRHKYVPTLLRRRTMHMGDFACCHMHPRRLWSASRGRVFVSVAGAAQRDLHSHAPALHPATPHAFVPHPGVHTPAVCAVCYVPVVDSTDLQVKGTSKGLRLCRPHCCSMRA